MIMRCLPLLGLMAWAAAFAPGLSAQGRDPEAPSAFPPVLPSITSETPQDAMPPIEPPEGTSPAVPATV
ncbi:MAG TPA: hypothetical protein VIO60_11640, partial [Rectinemataceae bacterium]